MSPGPPGVIMHQQQTRPDYCERWKGPGFPESRQGTLDAHVFDNPNRKEKDSIDLVLASLSVVLQEPSPIQISPWPYLSVTPQSQKQSGGKKQRWPHISMSLLTGRSQAHQLQQAH